MPKMMKAEPGQFPKGMKMTESQDDKIDRKMGIKEDSKKDIAQDKKNGVSQMPEEFMPPMKMKKK